MHFNVPSAFASILMLTASVSGCTETTASNVVRAYSDFQISSGVGGAALQEAQAQFPGSGAALTGDQLSVVNSEAHCAVIAEQAYIDAIAAAGASSATGKALAVGMIKNKVLKIFATLQANEGFIAQLGTSAAREASETELKTKLAANVAIDTKNKGAASKAASFTC